MRLSVFIILWAYITLAFSFAQAAEPLFLTSEEQTWLRQHTAPIRVHNEMSWEPYNFNEDGVPKGYSIDYMNLLARKLGVEIEYISGPTWEEFLGMMKAGTLDVMVNIANTKDRRQYLRFTEPYHITNVGLYVRSTEDQISDLDDLAGRRLGFTEGFFFDEFIRRYYPKIKVVTYDSTQASFVGVHEGTVDAAMDVPLVASRILRDLNLTDLKYAGKVSDPVFITTFSIATSKDNIILNDILQKAIDSVTSEEMQAINDKWALRKSFNLQLSTTDRDYLQKLGALRLCVHPARLPLEAVNQDATLTGISSEFVEHISKVMETPMRIVSTRNWDESLRFAKERKCDILPMIAKTANARKDLNFTSPWLSLEHMIATRDDHIYISDIDLLNDQKLGVVSGLSFKEDILMVHPHLNIVTVNNVAEGLTKVSNGELFGFIDTLATISRTLKAETIDNVKISGAVGIKANYAIGVRDDDGKLLDILERTIDSIDPADINAIYNRWLAIAYVERVDYSRFWWALLVFSLLLAYAYHRYREGQSVAATLRAAHGEIEEANRKLDRLARTDTLTGLANRLETDDILHREQARQDRYGTVYSIIMIDIDHFKAINDKHGHDIGDQVLKMIADCLQEHTRESDVVGRWGGEEFLVVCSSTATEGVRKLAEILRTEIESASKSGLPSCTASLGAATIGQGETTNDLMRRADKALYQAKTRGRNRVEMAS